MRTLQDGIQASQAARHGRGAGGLQRRHIEALLALDGHRSLGVMGEEQQDRIQQIAQEEDTVSQKRAAEYLAHIGEEEAGRRAENVTNPNAYHPKHNPDGHDLGTCPVCGHEAFCVEGLDPIFGRVGTDSAWCAPTSAPRAPQRTRPSPNISGRWTTSDAIRHAEPRPFGCQPSHRTRTGAGRPVPQRRDPGGTTVVVLAGAASLPAL
ncbi:hypothetical protein [Streptomyces sp. NPDC093594]|uniref:hypothetical protein n=1 Tax=Streptomyces sp. NPDC093594 TaxID=3155305 RepID=UPI00344BF967